MSIVHKNLAAGRWEQMPLAKQMANIGSEINRALNWKDKGRLEYSEKAAVRAIELILLSFKGDRSRTQLRELARLHETVADYFYGENQFGSTPDLLRRYFDQFALAANRVSTKNLNN